MDTKNTITNLGGRPRLFEEPTEDKTVTRLPVSLLSWIDENMPHVGYGPAIRALAIDQAKGRGYSGPLE